MGWFSNLRNTIAERMAVGTGESGIHAYLAELDSYYSTLRPADVHKTAAVEFAAGILGRAFMAAETRPAMPGLDPLTLSMIAWQTILLGNAVFRIVVRRGVTGPALLSVAAYEITGGPSPDSWRYQVKQQRPNGDSPLDTESLPEASVPYAGMVHVRYMPRSSAPWLGVSPLASAGFTAETLARIEKSLQDDASQPTGGIMPQPDGVSARAITQAQAALTSGKGATTLVETTAGGFGLGPSAAPRRDWEQKRFGPEPPAANIVLWEAATKAVLGALGINPSMYTSEGAALRESYRHLYSGTIVPLGRLIAAELSEKLERDIEILFPERIESDISALSRGFGALVQAGYAPEQVAEMLGFPVTPPEQPEPEPEEEQATPAPSQNGRVHSLAAL